MSFEPTGHVNHAIAELQNKVTAVVTGTTAAADIAVAGITLQDTLGSVLMFTAGSPSDVSAEASITSAGNIQLSTTNSSGNALLVEWYPKPKAGQI